MSGYCFCFCPIWLGLIPFDLVLLLVVLLVLIVFFLIFETVSLSFFISFSVFSSFSSFIGSGFASSDLNFSCWLAETHVLHSKSLFITNSFIPDNALLLSLVTLLSDAFYIHVLCNQKVATLHLYCYCNFCMYCAIMVVFFISTGGA